MKMIVPYPPTIKHYTLAMIREDKILSKIFKKRYKANYDFLRCVNDDVYGFVDACGIVWNNFGLEAGRQPCNKLSLIPELLGKEVITDRQRAAFMFTAREFNIMDW